MRDSHWIGLVVGEGRYRVENQLGAGGMGVVYRGWDLRLEAEVVIKVPHPSALHDPEFCERFRRETRSLIQLSHPHVVRLLDIGVHDGLPFAVMQYLPGGSLEARRPRDAEGRVQPLPMASLAEWLAPVADALDFVHAQGYVHRDVKPDNILFDRHGHAFLGDFGVAKALAASQQAHAAAHSLTGTGMVLGTPHYMAPEVVLGQSLDGRADQYAVGVMVYELLAGVRPIDGPTPTAILVHHTARAPLPLGDVAPHVPPEVSRAVMRALAKTPDERFARCAELAAAVLRGAAFPPAMPPPARSAPHPAPWTAPAAITPSGPSPPPRVAAATATPPAGSTAVPRVARAEGQHAACPVCGAAIRLYDSFRGRRAQCAACHASLQIAQDLSTVTEVLARPTSHAPAPAARSQAQVTTPLTGTAAIPTVAAATPSPSASVPPGTAAAVPPDAPPRGVVPWSAMLGTLAAHPRGRWVLAGGIGAVAVVCMALGVLIQSALSPRPIVPYWATRPPSDLPRVPYPGDKRVFTDETLQVRLTVANSPPPHQSWRFRAVEPPPGLTIDPALGVVTWPPGPGREPGTYRVKLEISDSRPDAKPVSMIFKVDVVERPLPELRIGSVQPARPVAPEPLTVHVAFSDGPAGMFHVEYRLPPSDTWNEAPGGIVAVPRTVPGPLQIALRVRGDRDRVSPEQLQTYEIAAPPRIREAAWLPVEALRAGFGYGPIAVSGGVRGEEWIVVTGLVPLRQQAAELRSAYAAGGFADDAPELPEYLGFELQRAEVAQGAAPAEVDWQTVDLGRYRAAKADWKATARENLSSQLTHPQLTVQLPQLVGAVHDPAIAGRGELKSAEQEWLDSLPKPAPAPPEAKRVGIADEPDTKKRPAGTIPADKTPPKEDLPRYLLFRYLDLDIELRRAYVYRVRLVFKNPFATERPDRLESADLARAAEFLSPWSALSPPLATPSLQAFFVGDVSPPLAWERVEPVTRILFGRNQIPPPPNTWTLLEPTATFAIAKWDPLEGAVVWAPFEKLGRGQLLNFDDEYVTYEQPDTGELTKGRMPLHTEEVLIDMVGGGSLPGVTRPVRAFGSLLLMTETGELHTQFSQNDLASYLEYKVVDPDRDFDDPFAGLRDLDKLPK